ncbi:DNA alkylation response protein, partial [Bosea sp. CER48]
MAKQSGDERWEVTNQVPVLADFDAFAADPVLPGIVSAFGADWSRERLHEAGRTVGSTRVQEQACLANRYTPELKAFDRFGNRIDEIAFHPAWHELIGLAIGQETHALAWNR